MKFRNFICLLLVVLIFIFTGCSTVPDLPENPTTETDPSKESESKTENNAESEEDNTEESTEQSTEENTEENTEESENNEVKKNYSVLFIGNSYTYTNDVPSIFKKFAEAAGYDIEVEAITQGGYYLEQMADPNDTYGAKVDKALSGEKKYDYVILQEQSVRPAANKVGNFYTAVRNLVARIRESGATPILYSTWGRATGSSTLTKYGWTNESMTWKLAAAYSAIGNELNVPVAYAGLAFYDVYTGGSGINLYNSDLSHPSYAGSYLAAATIFAMVFDEDPSELDFKTSLETNQAALLRQTAAKAVFQTPSIPEEYKTVSTGIGN